MVTSPRTPPPADDSDWDRKRRDILNGAAEVFFEHGFERGTTKEIAERVGLSQPSIYHYVGAKKELIAEIARQVDRDFTEALERGLRDAADPAEQLRNVIVAFTEALAVNRLTWAVYWQEQRAIPADVAEAVYDSQLQYVRRVDDVVRRCQEAGVLPAEHPTHVLTEAILGMLSWTYRWYKPEGRYGPEELAGAFSDLLGLRAGAAAPQG
ncbi:TetR/AcrR family transcriptional regulator [Conexibacter woesei]|uniref:Transcriptional regulator, TetR family n=1 Tax=Conexibacter woesei (strain DSM 14684 / CCUG 47730 / CIP 108061 / JCM 11494 / NBRC 100937 / ID131577) TaxID=469383 RepID=D3F7B0_CONWI|nr:TetR/AcrR family transcriptional regulator [Conexibacter woesei]ADB48881.1 transcriptional regulator, TetR family [Conexibacter woesei DSM 14684]